MKKIIILLAFTALVMVGCSRKETRVTHKYEVLLSTKDTMYIDAWYYLSSSATFTSKRTVVFYDTLYMDILKIHDPVYIREIK